MHYKRKSLTTNLVAIILLLSMVLCFTLSVTYATADSIEPALSADAGIATTALNDGDYSSYTDQELPSTLNKDNIAQYVPVDKFNTNGTTVFNGRNYGFVIYSDTDTNHVLIFKEEYTTHEDGDGYEVTLKVVYENSFFKSGNNIYNAGSPYNIALTNVKFNNFIFDTDMNNNIAYEDYNSDKDTGAYYTQVRYENQYSYYDKQLAGDTSVAVVSTVALGLSCFSKTSKYGTIVSALCTAASWTSIIYSLAKDHGSLWIDNAKFDTDIDFPLSRKGQLEKYGALKKDARIEVNADGNEYLSGDNGGGFARAIFRVMNDNNKDYYVYNNISFDINRYNGAQHHKVGDSSIESVYSVTGTDCNQYSQVIGSDDGFEAENYQRFSPMANTNIFNFTPDQAGDYSIMVPPNYYLSVDGEAQLDNWVHVGAEGCKIGIASSLGMKMGDKVYSRLLTQDFYNGEIAFTNILILKDQRLNIDEPNQVKDLAYSIESSVVTHNDVYVLDAGENVDSFDLYITDEDFNVLAKAVKIDGKLYVNYPMKATKLYSVVCINKSGETLDVSVVKESGMRIEEGFYSGIQGLYYAYKPKYTQFYSIYGAEFFDENMNRLSTKDVFLQSDETYYLLNYNPEEMEVMFSILSFYPYFELGDVYYSENNYNEIIAFFPDVTALYKFDDGTYDIYSNDLIAEDVSSCVLEKHTNYVFFKRQIGGYTKIYLDSEELSFGENSIEATSPYSVYTYGVEERARLEITIDKSNTFLVYDKAFNEIVCDHGYLLTPGEYYVIVKEGGAYNITIQEYLQEIDVTFMVDGNVYQDPTGATYYYGKRATLPVPTKDGYDFYGWSNGYTLIAGSNGETYEELLADSLTLEARWTIRAVVMEINLGENTAKWYWTGKKFSSQSQVATFKGEIIDQLINMKSEFVKLDDGKKAGHFLSTFDYKLISSVDHVDYYEFTPVWQEERYFIEFISPYSQIFTTTRVVKYLDEITQSVFPSIAFEFEDELCYITGWKSSKTSIMTFRFNLGYLLTDLTFGYGSEFDYDADGDGENDCTLVRLSALVEYVKYYVNINNQIYEIPHKNGYKIGSLGDYGYTESEYYGHNVLLKTSFGGAHKTVYYEFDKAVILVSELFSMWQRGKKEVTVNMIIDSELITVGLTYAYNYDSIYDEDKEANPTEYKGDKDVPLNSVFVRGYKLEDWMVDGAEMKNILNYQSLGINQYYSNENGVTLTKHLNAKLTRTTLYPTSLISYKISDEVVYVDLSRFSTMRGMTFTIAPSAKQVTFANGECTDTEITIESRSEKLIINFSQVSIVATHGEHAIDASFCPNLEVYSYNYVKLQGGEASTKEGGSAIYCNNLQLKGNEFYLKGGYSMSMNRTGRAGIYGVGASGSKLEVFASNVNVTGGSGFSSLTPSAPSASFSENDEIGADGKNGVDGVNGTNGAVAIYFPGDLIINKGGSL
ncbi:MAG: InlB B-repeat-containing protein, partial [Clostridia bacterium]|nr:InlB B-repeat-containing protein [Clostridia bacterium]